jgi:short-subunit dehydrogenase
MVETKVFQKGNVMSPQEVAEKAYPALMRAERVFIPGGMNKAMVFAGRFTTEAAQAKLSQKQYEDVPAGEHEREPGEIAQAAEVKRSR